jgi:hypothetical protein
LCTVVLWQILNIVIANPQYIKIKGKSEKMTRKSTKLNVVATIALVLLISTVTFIAMSNQTVKAVALHTSSDDNGSIALPYFLG